MAKGKEIVKPINEEAEKKIPVLTVLKNNTILKNIFLVDRPSALLSCSSTTADKDDREFDDIFLVGRHPDCNITLEHPSISRFHLRIHSNASVLSLYVVDLSSVHGTWVSGRKVEPGVRTELKEGDTLQLGVSSRVYRLHWLPVSQAYNLKKSSVPSLSSVEEEDQDQFDSSHEHHEKNIVDANSESQCSSCNGLDNSPSLRKLTPPEDYMLEKVDMSEGEAQTHEGELDSGPRNHGDHLKDNNGSQNLSSLIGEMSALSSMGLLPPSAPVLLEDSLCDGEAESKILPQGLQEESEVTFLQPPFENIKGERSPEASFFWKESQKASQTDYSESPLPNIQPISDLSIWSRRGKPFSVQVQTGRSRKLSSSSETDFDVEQQKHESFKVLSIPKVEKEVLIPYKEISSSTDLQVRCLNNFQEKLEKSPISTEKQICYLTNFHFGSFKRDSKENAEQKLLTPDDENSSPTNIKFASIKKNFQENLKKRATPVSLHEAIASRHEDVFTPDKENMSPNTLLLRSMGKRKALEDVAPLKFCKSSPLKNLVNHELQVKCNNSDNQNQTHNVLQQQNISRSQVNLQVGQSALRHGGQRYALESLLVNSDSKTQSTISSLEGSTRSGSSNNNLQTKEEPMHLSYRNIVKEEDSRWMMVVDTPSLLKKESRKALELLQGLKGTRLIIPRIVIRELDCMRRRRNLFRRPTDETSALQWIEQCMVNAKSWIHVQSSMEEIMPVAPTPAASPLSLLSEENWVFPFGPAPISPSSLQDIISPTAEDHVLECALFFRRIMNNGKVVLLSNDVSLKIKAMAEGLNCETAEEFRKSLVNPSSDRFLWGDSSARGPTWSRADDVIFWKRDLPGHLNKASKLGSCAKGLKLILPCNSH